MPLPVIAITPGEPAGIGPDLVIELAQRAHDAAILVAIGSAELLRQRATALGREIELLPYSAQINTPAEAGQLYVCNIDTAATAVPGELNPANADYVLATLSRACDGCLSGEFAALVTGPVHKGVINEAGVSFSGHTEFLAERTSSEQVVMMLATEGLRVALATTHLPLREVADAIDAPLLERVITTLVHDLQSKFGIAEPRILVCGLNPHAGEDGHLGSEDETVVKPVLSKLREQGMNLVGPLPADTLFVPGNLKQADAVLAMYHDQGLPVLKHLGFGRAVNITLGMPIIRSSVDHGTALELAATGRAHTGSLDAALSAALDMVKRSS